MKTNAERRKVASRLRSFGETDLGSVNRELWNLIADLIEPMDSESAEGAGSGVPQCDRDALLEIIEDLNICLEHAGPDIEREYVQLVRDRLLKACGGVISGEPDQHCQCAYCQGNLTFEIVDTETFSYTKTSVFDDLGTPCLKTKVNLQGLDFTTYMPISYCPFCGRKLER